MNNSTSNTLFGIYRKLFDHFGHRNWWPGETAFEVIIGAILTQNTAWTNVEKAIGNLKAGRTFDPKLILTIQIQQLAELIKPSGYYNQKAERLKSVCRYLLNRCNGEIGKLKEIKTIDLRNELLAIKGIGPETADSILLYALDRPVFVVDAYTKRALDRLGIIDGKCTYDEVQKLFMDNLPKDTALYNDYHAQWVALGKYYCKTKPECRGCPLREICRRVESYKL